MIAYPVNNHIITSPYGERVLQGKKQFHNGIDFISRDDNRVFSIADGIVVYDMDDYDHLKRWIDLKHSAGNYMIIQHHIGNEDYYVRYLHLEYNLKQKGESVKIGELIGKYGDYGISYGAHLHIDCYNIEWKQIDPTFIFSGVEA